MIHLHRHSEYSNSYAPDGMGSQEEYVARAVELGQPAIGHTDHATLAGSLHHIKACRDAGILPICGCECYFRDNRRHAKEQGVVSSQAQHLCLHAGSQRGWRSLLRATSEAFTTGDVNGDGYYGKPCLDWDVLERNSEGLICSTACIFSPVSGPAYFAEKEAREKGQSEAEILAARRAGQEQGERNFVRLLNIFKDRLWLEIMPLDFVARHRVEDGESDYLKDDGGEYVWREWQPMVVANLNLMDLGQRYGVPLIATCDAHTVRKEDSRTHGILMMANTGQDIETKQAKKDAGEDAGYGSDAELYLMSEEEVRDNFATHHPDIPFNVVDEAIKNTHLFASRTNLWTVDRDEKYPRIDGDADDIVSAWCREGMVRIGKDGDETYEERLRFEMDTLRSKNVVPYFAIVGDLIKWAHSTDGLPEVDERRRLVRDGSGTIVYGEDKVPIRTGLGRGSAAGCLVSYLIGITAIDPIAYGLLFERFLNPDRKGMPDIDLDFSVAGRELVKEYLRRRYGYDHVADIGAHQYWAPRKIVKEIGKVYNVPYTEQEAVVATIGPLERGWIKQREANEKLAEFCAKYSELDRDGELLDEHAHRASKHAAAVLITPNPVHQDIPLESRKLKDGTTTVVTAWSNRADFEIISDFGFLKLDVLGVEDLDRQDYAMALIREDEGARS